MKKSNLSHCFWDYIKKVPWTLFLKTNAHIGAVSTAPWQGPGPWPSDTSTVLILVYSKHLVRPLPFQSGFSDQEKLNLINQTPENPFSETHLIAPFVNQAEPLYSHPLSNERRSGPRESLDDTLTQTHTYRRLRVATDGLINTLQTCGSAWNTNRIKICLVFILDLIQRCRSSASTATVLWSCHRKKSKRMIRLRGRLWAGWFQWDFLIGIYLVTLTQTHTHTCTFPHSVSSLLLLLVFHFLSSLSHLVISWSVPFLWRTTAVEMDYDYEG